MDKSQWIICPVYGMEIPLSYYDKNGQQERIFTLSGWFRSYIGTGMAFVSESYCANAGYTLQDNTDYRGYPGYYTN